MSGDGVFTVKETCQRTTTWRKAELPFAWTVLTIRAIFCDLKRTPLGDEYYSLLGLDLGIGPKAC